MQRMNRSALGMLVVATLATGCGQEEIKYEPRTAPSGAKASLPPVPNVPQKPIKVGDAYTVWGASYSLRNRVRRDDVAGKKLTIVGYITKTNLPDAPECAVHETGKADPDNCNPPIPSFWIADDKSAEEKDSIKVMGWASNFAQIYDAVKEYDKKEEEGEVMDEFWGVKLPNPLPGKGAKVSIKGQYGTTFTRSSAGTEADPIMGILTADEITYTEKPPEVATLPGMD